MGSGVTCTVEAPETLPLWYRTALIYRLTPGQQRIQNDDVSDSERLRARTDFWVESTSPSYELAFARSTRASVVVEMIY